MQRLFDLQLKQQEEVFVCSFIDLFVDYLKSLSSLDERNFLQKKFGCFVLFNYISVLYGFLHSSFPY
jgi:hypothetical protein